MAKCPLTADSLREQRQEIRIELQAGEKRFEGRLQSLAPDTRHAALPHAPVLRVLFPELPGREARGQRLAALAAPRECERLAEAIGQGGPLQALVARLQERQALAEGLGRQLAAKALQAPTIDRRGLERRIRAKLQDWRGLLERNVAEGRAALRALLIGPIRFTPVREERRRGYRFELTIALDRLLAGVIELPTKMASPRGIDGRWNVPTKVASPEGPAAFHIEDGRLFGLVDRRAS